MRIARKIFFVTLAALSSVGSWHYGREYYEKRKVPFKNPTAVTAKMDLPKDDLPTGFTPKAPIKLPLSGKLGTKIENTRQEALAPKTGFVWEMDLGFKPKEKTYIIEKDEGTPPNMPTRPMATIKSDAESGQSADESHAYAGEVLAWIPKKTREAFDRDPRKLSDQVLFMAILRYLQAEKNEWHGLFKWRGFPERRVTQLAEKKVQNPKKLKIRGKK